MTQETVICLDNTPVSYCSIDAMYNVGSETCERTPIHTLQMLSMLWTKKGGARKNRDKTEAHAHFRCHIIPIKHNLFKLARIKGSTYPLNGS